MFLGGLKACGREVNRVEFADARKGPVEVGRQPYQAFDALGWAQLSPTGKCRYVANGNHGLHIVPKGASDLPTTG